jgi:hypothetical protein
MKNTLRQIIVVLAVLGTLTVNALANILPINGVNTGQVSDSFNVYFVPAGYVFSIWGVIYVGLLAYMIFQLLPSQKESPRMQATGWWVALGGLANSTWIFLWHYGQFVGTLGAMLILLATLILVYLRLGTGVTKVSKLETWMVRVPFSIYLGWISVATIANVSDVLHYNGWNQWGLSDGTWMIILLAVVAVLGNLMNFLRRDIAYAAVLLWALAGIAYKFPQQGIITIATWVAFALVALGLAAAFVIKKKA